MIHSGARELLFCFFFLPCSVLDNLIHGALLVCKSLQEKVLPRSIPCALHLAGGLRQRAAIVICAEVSGAFKEPLKECAKCFIIAKCARRNICKLLYFRNKEPNSRLNCSCCCCSSRLKERHCRDARFYPFANNYVQSLNPFNHSSSSAVLYFSCYPPSSARPLK